MSGDVRSLTHASGGMGDSGAPLVFGRGYTRSILRACERGEQQYCHTADTSGRAPARCVYALGGGVEVTVQELQVAEGGLGWRVWVGALVLAEWMVGHAEALRGRSVLELGSGLGLCGLVAARLGAAEVTMSDCLAPLVDNLRLNAVLNASRAPAGTRVRARAVDVFASLGPPGASCAPLAAHRTMEERVHARHGFSEEADWLRPDETFEVVLASEVLYEKYHALAVAGAVARHLARAEGASDGGEPSVGRAYIVYVNRDDRFLCADGILWAFIGAARARGLAVLLAAGRQRARPAVRAAFDPAMTAADAERARAAVEPGAGEDDVQLALLTLCWPDALPSLSVGAS